MKIKATAAIYWALGPTHLQGVIHEHFYYLIFSHQPIGKAHWERPQVACHVSSPLRQWVLDGDSGGQKGRLLSLKLDP